MGCSEFCPTLILNSFLLFINEVSLILSLIDSYANDFKLHSFFIYKDVQSTDKLLMVAEGPWSNWSLSNLSHISNLSNKIWLSSMSQKVKASSFNSIFSSTQLQHKYNSIFGNNLNLLLCIIVLMILFLGTIHGDVTFFLSRLKYLFWGIFKIYLHFSNCILFIGVLFPFAWNMLHAIRVVPITQLFLKLWSLWLFVLSTVLTDSFQSYLLLL